MNTIRYGRGARLSVLVLGGLLLMPLATSAQSDYDDSTVLILDLDGPSGVIRPDPDRIALVEMLLTLVRDQHPFLTEIHARPDWAPGQLLVGLDETAWAEFLAGTFTGFDALFVEYPVADVSHFTIIPVVRIEFLEPLHAANLAPQFAAVAGVRYAEPNGILGDGDDITLQDLGGPFVFKHGWGDCPSGCLFSHSWQVEIFGGAATITDEWGDEVPVPALPTPWSEVKALYR